MRGDQFHPAGQGRSRLLGDVPPSVVALAGVLTLIFAIMALSPPAIEAWISVNFGLSPQRLFAGARGPGGWPGALLPLLTHFLIHASVAHLLFNLLWLAVFGAPIARRFRSPLRFFTFFAACSVAGGVFFSAFHLTDPTLLVGASGGITGQGADKLRFAFHRPFTKAASAKGVLPLTDKSVLTWSAVVIGMNASIALFGPGVGAGEAEIAWQAHVGGYLFGLIAFPLFDPRVR